MLASYVLLLFLPLADATCPTTLPTDAAFAAAAQYHAGAYGSASSVHLLSLAPSAPSSFSLAYNLASGSFMKTPSTQCPQSCLYRLRAMGKPGKDGSSSSIIMLWDAGQSPPATNILYSAYTTTVIPGDYLYCSNVAGTCGASVPLYLYYNSETDDYQLRGERDTVDDAAAKLQNMGLPVCWMFPALPTTSSSTSTVTNGTRTRHTRDAIQSNATAGSNSNPTAQFFAALNPNANSTESKTDDQRSKILPDWFNVNSTNRPESFFSENQNNTRPPRRSNTTDRFALPTVTSHLVTGRRTGTDVSMDPKKEKAASADSIRAHGNSGDVRDGNETATKRPEVEGRRDWLDKGKEATGNVSSDPQKNGLMDKTLSSLGMKADGKVSDLLKELGKGRENNTGNIGNSTDQPKKKAGSNYADILRGLASRVTGRIPDSVKEKLSNLTLPPGNQSILSFLKDVSTENIEKKLADAGFDLPSNVSIDKILVYFKNQKGNVTLEDVVKGDGIEKALTSLGIEVPANFSVLDLLPLLGKDKTSGNGSHIDGLKEKMVEKGKEMKGLFEKALSSLGIDVPSNVSDSDVLKALGKDKIGNGSIAELLKEKGKEMNGEIEKIFVSLGVEIPSNVSASDILKELKGKTDQGMVEKALSNLGIDVPSNFSVSDLRKKLGDGKNDGNQRVSVIDLLKNLGKDKIEKALSSLGIDVPSNVSVSDILKELGKEKSLPGGNFSDLLKELGKGKKLEGSDFLHVLNESLAVLDDDKKESRRPSLHSTAAGETRPIRPTRNPDVDGINKNHTAFLDSVDRQAVAAVEKILHRFNTSLADVHPSFDDRNESTLLATIELPVKLNRTELEQIRNETAEVKDIKVFEDRLTIVGGGDVTVEDGEKHSTNRHMVTVHGRDNGGTDGPIGTGEPGGTRWPDGTKYSRGTRSPIGESRGTSGTRSPDGSSNGTRGTRGPHRITFFPPSIMLPSPVRTVPMVTDDVGKPIGTRNPGGPKSSASPSLNSTNAPLVSSTVTISIANQSNQSIQPSVAIQTVTVKGSSTTTSSGSSTSAVSGAATTTVVGEMMGSSTTSPPGKGSSTTTTPYTGPPTLTTTANPAASTTTTPYTGQPTTSTTAAPYTGPSTTSTSPAPYTGPSTTAGPSVSTTTTAPYTGPSTTTDPAASTTTSSPGTGSVSSTTTVKPTTTTSPYVYSATTDAAGTYGPGDQKLENGTVVRPNGDTIYPNGTVRTGDGSIIEGGKKTDPDGTVHNPDGSTKYPNGTVVYPSDTSPVSGSGGKSGDDTPTWVIPVIIVGSMLVGVGSLAMIVFGVTSMMKGAPPSTVNPYEVPNQKEQWPNQRQPTPPSADLPPPVSEPVMTAQPQSFGATQTLAGGPNPLYFG